MFLKFQLFPCWYLSFPFCDYEAIGTFSRAPKLFMFETKNEQMNSLFWGVVIFNLTYFDDIVESMALQKLFLVYYGPSKGTRSLTRKGSGGNCLDQFPAKENELVIAMENWVACTGLRTAIHICEISEGFHSYVETVFRCLKSTGLENA